LKTFHDVAPYGGNAPNIVTNSSLLCTISAAGIPMMAPPDGMHQQGKSLQETAYEGVLLQTRLKERSSTTAKFMEKRAKARQGDEEKNLNPRVCGKRVLKHKASLIQPLR
jgi:hypothetical protein